MSVTAPAQLMDLQNGSVRLDRFPTLAVHMPRELDPSLPTRAAWNRTLHGIDPALSETLASCGSHGPLQVVFTPTGRRLEGGCCQDPLCIACGPQLAARESRLLSDTILHLTAEEGLAPDQFVFGAITMSHAHIPDTQERVQSLGTAMEAWTRQSWFGRFILGWAFAFDVAGTLRRNHGVLHAHWHVFLVMRQGADLERFKEKTHDWFQAQVGRRHVRWNTDPDQWASWLGIAHLTPTEGNGKSGYRWRASSEVGACLLKPGKHNEGHSSFYTRHAEDLKALVPLMKEHARITRGGIVAKMHTLLELRDEVHQEASIHSIMRLPDALWAKLDDLTRRFLLNAVHSARYSEAMIRDLVRRARTMPLMDWEALLVQQAAALLAS